MKIPVFDVTRQYKELQNELEHAVISVLRSGKYIMGEQGRNFEAAMCSFLKTKHAYAVANGSDALVLALMALGIKAGDEVITTPFTFFATAGCVVRLGAKPVFVDVRPDTLNIDETKIEAAITENTKAIIIVHLYGQLCNMPAIMAVASKHNIPVIEDAAQAIGASYNGQMVGSFGAITTYSFFPTKNLAAAGDAGLVTSNDDELARKLSILRVHGASKKYFHDLVGMNSRMDEVQAAILNVKLKHLPKWTAQRRNIALQYTKQLADIADVHVPTIDPKAVHVWHQYTIKCKRRDELAAHLLTLGIGTGIHYPKSLTQQECFAELSPVACPVSEELTTEVLSLPMFPELTSEEVKTVCDAIRAFYDNSYKESGEN